MVRGQKAEDGVPLIILILPLAACLFESAVWGPRQADFQQHRQFIYTHICVYLYSYAWALVLGPHRMLIGFVLWAPMLSSVLRSGCIGSTLWVLNQGPIQLTIDNSMSQEGLKLAISGTTSATEKSYRRCAGAVSSRNDRALLNFLFWDSSSLVVGGRTNILNSAPLGVQDLGQGRCPQAPGVPSLTDQQGSTLVVQ